MSRHSESRPGKCVMPKSHVVLLRSKEGRQLVRSKCAQARLEISVLEQLIAAEIDQQGKLRKHGIREVFDEIFAEIDDEADC